MRNAGIQSVEEHIQSVGEHIQSLPLETDSEQLRKKEVDTIERGETIQLRKKEAQLRGETALN